jgi:DNA-binding transcriptional ArsR family regulator
MSKFGETKKKILELLYERNMTLSEISERLNLAPSTVAQHLKELEEAGAIKKSDEQHSRKWIYYEINENKGIAISSSKIGKVSVGIAVFLLAIFGIAYLFASMPQNVGILPIGPNSTISGGATIFSISDAPTFYNITSLNLSISYIEVHSTTTGKWYKINVDKTFNLIELRNISKVIVGANLSHGTYNEIVLNIANANATINGKVENIFIPSKKLRIITTFNITNSSTNAINLDFDLEDSLHITGNGEIIMTPVIGLSYYHGPLEVRGFILHSAKFSNKEIFGMNENGSMVPNSRIGYWIEKSGARIRTTNSTYGVVFVRTPNKLIIGSLSNLNASIKNITVVGNNTTCILRGRFIVCNSSEHINASKIKEIVNNIRAINISNITNQTATANASININYTLTRIRTIYKSANDSIISCNTSSDCLLVPLTFCQNNLPSQVACINSNYYQEYMYYYQELKEHAPIMCPMFIAPGYTTCSCIHNTCVPVYHGSFIMPANS